MDNDMQQAKRLLDEYRQSTLEQRTPSRLSRKPTEGVYTYQEINDVLAQVVDWNGPLGLIDALLSLGRDANVSHRRGTKIWNVVRRKSQRPERNEILLKAASYSPAEVVRALASHADQSNLNDALHLGIVRGDLAVLKVLLAHGADPHGMHEAFQHAVVQNRLDMVEILLSGVKKPCHSCRSSALLVAVRNESSEALRMLMKSGADPNHDEAVALVAAAQARRPDLFAILLSGPSWPSPQSLDMAVGKAYVGMAGKDAREGREIIDLALSAGAQGPQTTDLCTKVFAETVRNRQLGLLDVLLKFSRPSGHHETVAIIQAIETREKDILAKFLRLNPTPTSLAVAVAQAMKIPEPAPRREIIRMLISSGARGECIASALVSTVRLLVDGQDGRDQDAEAERELLNLLLDDGSADIDYQNGEALQMAVRASCLDICQKILSKRSSPETVGTALWAALSIQDPEHRDSMVELLMGAEVSDAAVNRCLLQAVRGGPGNSYLVQLLLSRANVDHNSGEVFVYAIRNRDLKTLQLLLLRHPNSTSLFTAVDEALSAERGACHGMFEVLIPCLSREHVSHAFKNSALKSYPDLFFMRMLLQAGADVTVDRGVCVKQAARNLDIDVLLLLTEFSGYNENIYTSALADLLESGRHWLSFDHLESLRLILSHGASGPVLNAALVTMIEQLGGDNSQTSLMERLLEMLLASEVDVNYDNGIAVQLVAKQGNTSILRYLLASGATMETAAVAFSAAITAGHSEQRLLKLIDIFTDQEGKGTIVDVNLARPGMLPPLLLCLDAYPQSTALVAKLLRIGCKLEGVVMSRVYGMTKEYDSEPNAEILEEEALSVLAWALLQPNNKISSDVINTIIDHGANVLYATPNIRITPLMIAANFGRLDVVQKLFDAGAKPAAKDILGRPALFYASRAGNADIVKLLLERKPVTDDGSLHEASREFHTSVMVLLIKGGYDPNYRSTKHGGRTALGEMALKGRIPDDVSDAEEAIDVLKAAGADPLVQIHGKSIIYLAMENAHPIPMTQVLLDRFLWKTINSNANIYQADKLHYSPTMYLSKTATHPSRAFSAQLLTLLRHHGAEDRFYSSDPHHPQPHGAAGLPPEIARAEQRRLAREAQLAQEEERHRLALRREAETHAHRAALAESAHGAGKAMELASAAARREIAWGRHRDELAMGGERREADVAHRERVHRIGLAERDEAEAQRYVWREAREGQAAWVEDGRQQRRIGYLEREGMVRADQQRERNAVEVSKRCAVGDAEVRHLRHQGRAQVDNARAMHAAELDYRAGLARGDVAHLQGKARVGLAQARARHGLEQRQHEMRMLEMQSERMNIAGRVNLQEWAAHKASQGQAAQQGRIEGAEYGRSQGLIGWSG